MQNKKTGLLIIAVWSALSLCACGADRLTLLSGDSALPPVSAAPADEQSDEPQESAAPEQEPVAEPSSAPEPIPHEATDLVILDYSTPVAQYDNYEIYYYDSNFILLTSGANNIADDFSQYPVPDDCRAGQPKIPDQYNNFPSLLNHTFDYYPSSYSKYEDGNDYITYRTIAEYGPFTETEFDQELYRSRSILPKQIWYGAEIYSIFTKENNPYSIIWEQTTGSIVANWYFACEEGGFDSRSALCSSLDLKSFLTLADSYVTYDHTDEYHFAEDENFIYFFVSGHFRTGSYLPGIDMGDVRGELTVVFDKVYGDLIYQYIGSADGDRAAELAASIPGCFRIGRLN